MAGTVFHLYLFKSKVLTNADSRVLALNHITQIKTNENIVKHIFTQDAI